MPGRQSGSFIQRGQFLFQELCFSFQRVAARVCCPESLNHLFPSSSARASVHLSIPLSLSPFSGNRRFGSEKVERRKRRRRKGKEEREEGVHDCFDLIAVVVEEMMAAEGGRGNIFCPIEDVGQVRAAAYDG